MLRPLRLRPLYARQPQAALSPRLTQSRVPKRASSTLPRPSHFSPRTTRFHRYENSPADVTKLKASNPLNYIDNEKDRLTRNAFYRQRMWMCATGIVLCLGVQLYLVFNFSDLAASDKAKPSTPTTASVSAPTTSKHRLDAPPGSQTQPDQPIRIVPKPGQPAIKLDPSGIELVETGTSTIPHFPRHIHVAPPRGSVSPASSPPSSVPGRAVEEGVEEYTLLGLGVRTVSFLSIQVYVLGMYVRTSDLDALQAAFVRHVNAAGSSLIPSEKEMLRAELMSDEASLEVWDKVLKETRVRSAVRIVPTRGTDWAHLRDGWVRGITARTQEASRKYEGKSEFDEEGFGEAVGSFKQLLGGKGKAPKGSMVLLTRDERGVLGLQFQPEKEGKGEAESNVSRGGGSVLGTMEDERISRMVWLGYLGGKNVSSKGARKSIVDGVMDLVERPMGTVGSQVV